MPQQRLPAVLATVELGVFAKKSEERCALSDAVIATGDMVYAIKGATYLEMSVHYVRSDMAQRSPAFLRALTAREQCLIPVEALYRARLAANPELDNQEKDIQRLRNRLTRTAPELTPTLDRLLPPLDVEMPELADGLPPPRPGSPPPTPEDLWEELRGTLSTLRPEADAERRRRTWDLLGTLAMSVWHPRVASLYAELSPEIRAILALSDNQVFARLAATSGLLPEWEAVRERLTRERQDLEDVLFLADWGRRHPDALELWQRVSDHFDPFGFADMPWIGFGDILRPNRMFRHLSLYLARPDLCPMLRDFDPEVFAQKSPDSCSGHLPRELSALHVCPHLFRAKLFSRLLAGDAETARRGIRLIRERGNRLCRGDAPGFSETTANMAAAYLEKHFMA